jgi:hypothetical protein
MATGRLIITSSFLGFNSLSCCTRLHYPSAVGAIIFSPIPFWVYLYLARNTLNSYSTKVNSFVYSCLCIFSGIYLFLSQMFMLRRAKSSAETYSRSRLYLRMAGISSSPRVITNSLRLYSLSVMPSMIRRMQS